MKPFVTGDKGELSERTCQQGLKSQGRGGDETLLSKFTMYLLDSQACIQIKNLKILLTSSDQDNYGLVSY